MKSAKPGKTTSAVEVTHVSARGVWLLIRNKEHFIAFGNFLGSVMRRSASF